MIALDTQTLVKVCNSNEQPRITAQRRVEVASQDAGTPFLVPKMLYAPVCAAGHRHGAAPLQPGWQTLLGHYLHAGSQRWGS